MDDKDFDPSYWPPGFGGETLADSHYDIPYWPDVVYEGSKRRSLKWWARQVGGEHQNPKPPKVKNPRKKRVTKSADAKIAERKSVYDADRWTKRARDAKEPQRRDEWPMVENTLVNAAFDSEMSFSEEWVDFYGSEFMIPLPKVMHWSAGSAGNKRKVDMLQGLL